jgi:hypothetical protein
MHKAMPRPIPRTALRASPRTNGSAAPVCPISQSQAVPPQPPRKLPGLPKVTDLPSVINVLNQIVMMLNNPVSNYTEIERVTTPVRIYNPNDSEQWVDVDRITFLNLEDSVTGGQIIWKY